MHTLLGFDLRKCADDYLDGFWLSEHRAEYLLRPDIPWPLSVDPLVWPSVFEMTAHPERGSPNAIAITPATTVQLGVKLWDDKAAMEDTFKTKGSGCIVRVAIELYLERAVEDDPDWNFLEGSLAVDERLPNEWVAVGYDVADRYMLSGLMNCGYRASQLAEFRPWSSTLNDFGLIDDIEAAKQFKNVTEERVPEHTPFFVYRLWVDPLDMNLK